MVDTLTKPVLLFVLRHSPYGSSLGRAGLDAAMAAAAFEQNLDMLFMGEGVWQLVPDQQPAEIGRKAIGNMIDSLPLFDIDTVYVDAVAWAKYGLPQTALPPYAKLLEPADMSKLMAGGQHIVSF